MKTNSRKTPRLPEVLVTLQVAKLSTPMDATTTQELNMLLLSYNSNNQKFRAAKSLHFNWYLCSRATTLNLHKAHMFIKEALIPDSNLVCHIRRLNPNVIGYGWAKIGTEHVNTRLRKYWLAAILKGDTEIKMFIPEKLLMESHNVN